MKSRDPRSRAIAFAIFMLPLILVKGTEFMLGDGGLQAAIATTHVEDPPEIAKFEHDWTEQQKEAARHVAHLASLDFGPSPLLHHTSRDPENPIIIETTDPERIIPIPDVKVKIIMKSSKGNVALIGRRRFRVGDEIGEDGWVIEEIHDRSVDIMHPETGQKATLVVPMPR